MNFSQKFNKLALRAMLVLGLTASGAAHAACDVSLVSVFANGQAVLKADCGTVPISQITWIQNSIPLSTPPLTVSTTQDIYYTTAITTGTSTFTATGNNGVVLAGKAATIISGQTTLTVAVGLVTSATGTPVGSVTSASPTAFTCNGGSCAANYSVGASVTLTATPGNGTSFFGGWGGDCSGTGACVLAMTGPRTVTATFNSAPPPPAPSCSVSASQSSVSVGTAATVTFTASCSNSPTSYVWTGTPSVSGSGSSVTVNFPATTAAGTYAYSVTATNAGGSSTASTSVTVSAVTPPSCTLSANPTAVVTGTSSTLTASCSQAATSYAWTGATCASTSSSCVVTPTVATTYTVTGSNAGGAGAASAGVTVTVSAAPPPSTAPVGCTVQDVTWARSLNHIVAGAPNITMTTDMAFKVPLTYFGNKTSGAYRYGDVQFYELGAPVNYSISASPCDFVASTTGTCLRTIPAAQSVDNYYVTSDSPAPPSGYCQLPALPSGQTYYFVNVRPTSTLANFILLFD